LLIGLRTCSALLIRKDLVDDLTKLVTRFEFLLIGPQLREILLLLLELNTQLLLYFTFFSVSAC